jgi:hypothetical protein
MSGEVGAAVIQIRWNYNAELDLNCLPTRTVEQGGSGRTRDRREDSRFSLIDVPAGNEGARQFASRTSIQNPYEIDERQ